MQQVLIITDSRGFALRQQVDSLLLNTYNVNITVVPKSGATILEAVKHAFHQAGDQVFDIIYLMAGANDLSVKHGFRDISPEYNNRYNLVGELMQKYYKARILLDMIGTRIVVCDLIGVNFEQYNIRYAPFYEHQIELNAGVILLNEYIRHMNNERMLYGPYIAEYTHKQRETGNLTHRYWLTTIDGIHLRRQYSVKIMDRIVINILQLLGLW